jgi:hypothetical protein
MAGMIGVLRRICPIFQAYAGIQPQCEAEQDNRGSANQVGSDTQAGKV